MPRRPLVRETQWLLPPSLEDAVPAGHFVRFLASVVDGLTPADWHDLGISTTGAARGRASYSVRALLGAWLFGFFAGIRTTRKLEAACKEQLPLLWLVGMEQPDHTTLWAFYDRHQEKMRELLPRTIAIAHAAGLVDLAVQAVDGTKIWGNASRERYRSAAGLRELLAKTDEAIAELEARNRSDEPCLPELPEALHSKQALHETIQAALVDLSTGDALVPPVSPRPAAVDDPALRWKRAFRKKIRAALADLAAEEAAARPSPAPTASVTAIGTKTGKAAAKKEAATRGPRRNITDPDVRVMKGRHTTYGLGYNAQAVTSPMTVGPDGRKGVLFTAGAVVTDGNDTAQLVPMVERAEAATGKRAKTAADPGYHSAAALAGMAERGQTIVMPDPKEPKPEDRYAKEFFVYDAERDTYQCPEGKPLVRAVTPVIRSEGKLPAIRYRAKRRDCLACPALARCVSTAGTPAHGRSITITEEDERLRAHREWMKQEEAQALYRLRKEWSEQPFALVKTELGVRTFLHRGLVKVTNEWHLVLTAANLRTLYGRWKRLPADQRFSLRMPAA